MGNKIPDELLLALAAKNSGGGGGGTTNYNDLNNKPKINNVELSGNKSASALGLQADVNLSLTNDAVVSDRDIQDGQGNTLSVLAEALTKTASGNPVVISDCAGGKARSLITEINAIQDLHGYDHPWAGGAGKNKLPMTVESIKAANTSGTWSGNVYTINGVAVTVLTDSADNVMGFNLNGVCTANFNFYVTAIEIGLEANGRTYSGLTTGSDATYFLYWDGAGVQVATGEVTITSGRNPIRMGRIVVRANVNLSNLKVYPMVRPSTVTDPTFAPYSNICPISGRTEAVLTRSKYGLSFVQGGLQDNTGAEVESNSRIRTDYIPFTDSSFTLSMENGENDDVLRNSIYLYDAQKHFIATKQYELNPSTFPVNVNIDIPTNTAYMRFVVQKSDATANISPSNRIMTVNSTNFTIQLGQTVYGADINWDTGVATVKTAILAKNTADMDNNEDYPGWRNSGIRALVGGGINRIITGINTNCGTAYGVNTTGESGDVVLLPKDYYGGKTQTEWISLAMDIQIPVTLATPIELTLTPTEVQMLKGYNRVTIESGTITLDYIAKAISGNDEEIAPLVGDKATKSYAVNDFIERADGLYRVTAPIASGASFTANNTVKMSIGEALTYLYNK